MLIMDSQYDAVNEIDESGNISLWHKILSSLSNFYRIDPDRVSAQLKKGNIYRIIMRQ